MRCSTFAAAKLEEHVQRACPKDDAALKKVIVDIDAAFLSTGKPSGSTCTMPLGPKECLRDSKHLKEKRLHFICFLSGAW